ncbi:MAG: hypothetical protein JO307_18860 [Bryobacterales bacterium]|nr:hypothetical protein [Bryobacterales bacterium]MBV9396890.1 hypothetical protein [Bryobacterales bacterium]
MRPRFIAAFAILLPLSAAPEIVCALGNGAAGYKPAEDQRPSPDAMQLAGRLNAAVKSICGQNCPTMALFRNATAPNAMLINDSGQAKIVYSPQFLSAAYDRFGDVGIVAIMAHVLGHALDGTLGASWIKNSWTAELRADAWAGCILAKTDTGAGGLEPALGALQSYPSPAHAGWNQRLPVVRAGYLGCAGEPAKFDKAARTPAVKN